MEEENSRVFKLYNVRFPGLTYNNGMMLNGPQEAQLTSAGGCPIPEGCVLILKEATDQIEKARKEHPEWLTDVKGFGN
ncbi:MAG: hypothetical protein SVM80_06320 [Halobacteriota archaeon]|nr:hypothetical protein [Halobacteriota archaeon]